MAVIRAPENYIKDIEGNRVEDLMPGSHELESLNFSINDENRTAEILMHIEKLKGPVENIAGYSDALQLKGFEIGGNHGAIVGRTGSLRISTPVRLHNCFCMTPDSPIVELLVDACDKGSNVGEIAIVILRNASATTQNKVTAEIKFTKCRVTMVKVGEETLFSFGFSAIELTYNPLKVDGTAAGVVSGAFSLEKGAVVKE